MDTNVSDQSCLVANCSTIPYQEGEMIRYAPDSDKVPYLGYQNEMTNIGIIGLTSYIGGRLAKTFTTWNLYAHIPDRVEGAQ